MKKFLICMCVLFALILVGSLVGGFIYKSKSVDKTPNEEVVDFSNVNYFAFGDSITYGFNSATTGQMENPYSKLVAKNLGFKSYKNHAISGATIATGVSGRTSINTQVNNATGTANIISLMGGVNDYYADVEIGKITDTKTTTFYGSLNNICKVLKENYADAYVFFMTPYKCLYNGNSCYTLNSAGYNLQNYANAMKEVAKKYNIPVLDMYVDGNFEVEMTQSGSDGVHPSPNFIATYTAPQITQFIKDNYKK